MKRINRTRGRLVFAVVTAFATTAFGVGVSPAAAAGPVLTVSVARVSPTVDAGGDVSFTIGYACSSLVEVCASPVITAPAPVGTGPDSQPYPVVAGSGTVTTSSDVASHTASGPVVIHLKDLPGGTTGQIAVSWQVPNITTPTGTQFGQQITAVTGSYTTSATAPTTTSVTAVSDFAVALQTINPTTPARVQPDQDVTYRMYDCNPGTNALGGLGYANLTLTFTLPTGAVIVDAGGAQVAGTVLTWTVAAPSNNDCQNPQRTYTVVARYPSATFVPPSSLPPTTNAVTASLAGSAVPLGGGTTLSDSASVNHTFTGASPNTSGMQWLFYQWAGSGMTSQYQKLSKTNTSTPYGYIGSQWWWWDSPGEVQKPGVYQLNSYVVRAPCVVNGAVTSPDSSTYDPIQNGTAGTMPDQPNPCSTPAFATTRLEFRDAIAPLIWQVEVRTTDGTTSRLHTWAPTGTPSRAFYLDVHASAETTTSSLATFSDPAEGVGIEEQDGPTVISGATPAYLNQPATDMTMTNPETLSMEVPDGETVTDVRVVYRDVPYYTRVFTGVWGTTTPAFAALGSGVTSMSLNTRSFTNPEKYTTPGAPVWGWLLVGNPSLVTMQFITPQPDPQVTKTSTKSLSSLAPGDVVPWEVTVTNGPNGSPLNPKLVDVIPPGLELDPASVKWKNLGMLDNVQPTLTESTTTEFGDTRTVLTWTWPATHTIDNPGDTTSSDYPFHQAGQVPTVTFNTTVTLSAREGLHDGDDAQSVTGFDGTQDLTVGTSTDVPVDTHDLDKDGNRTERVAFASDDWTVQATSGVRIRQLVKGDLDATWSTSGHSGATWDPAGGTASYRLEITNPNNSAVDDLVAYDILPFVGDTAIGQALGAEPRGSTWQPTFAGILSTPSSRNTEVFYSTSTNPCRPELFPGGQPACDDDWSATPPGDLSEVRALKFVDPDPYGPTTADNPPYVIDFAMDTPALAGFSSVSDVAKNNVAWRASRMTSAETSTILAPAEAPSTDLTLAPAQIGDFVWDDVNRNGLQDAGEPGVADVEVWLLTTAGEPVLDPDGDPVVTVTDSTGHYGFEVPGGTYRVAFDNLPDGYGFTLQTVGGNRAIDSDPDPATGVTADVTVSGVAPRLDIDAGLVGESSPPTNPGTDGPSDDLANTGTTSAPLLLAALGFSALAGLVLRTRARRGA